MILFPRYHFKIPTDSWYLLSMQLIVYILQIMTNVLQSVVDVITCVPTLTAPLPAAVIWDIF